MNKSQFMSHAWLCGRAYNKAVNLVFLTLYQIHQIR